MKRKEVFLVTLIVLIFGIFLFSINQKIERMERQLKTIEYRLGNPNQRGVSSYRNRREENIVSKLDYISGRLNDIEGYLVK